MVRILPTKLSIKLCIILGSKEFVRRIRIFLLPLGFAIFLLGTLLHNPWDITESIKLNVTEILVCVHGMNKLFFYVRHV